MENDFKKQQMKQDYQFMRKALIDAGAEFKSEAGKSFCCPFHDDSHPSANLFQGENGIWLFKCHACGVSGDVFTVMAKTQGCKPGDIINKYKSTDRKIESNMAKTSSNDKQCSKTFPNLDMVRIFFEKTGFKIEAEYVYQQPDKHEPVLYIIRLIDKDGTKSFRQVTPYYGRYILKGMSKNIPLYKSNEIITSDQVFVCEGEKATEALRDIGLVATTSAGGCKASDKSDWKVLAGKEVYIWPDNDDPGLDYALSVAWKLGGYIPEGEVRVLEPEKLQIYDTGDDAFDYVQRCRKEGLSDIQIKEKILSAFAETDVFTPGGIAISEDKPFPICCLPAKAREIVIKISESICCDNSIPALALLCTASAAIGNTRRVMIKDGWCESAIIWGTVVAGSSVGKSPAINAIIKPYYDLQNHIMNKSSSDLLNTQGGIAPYKQRLIVSDITFEALANRLSENPHGLLLHRDELAGWFNSFNKYKSGGDDKQNWLSVWSAGQITVDRKNPDSSALAVDNSFVSVVGTIQPEVLVSALKGENSYNGMSPRFLYAVPGNRKAVWSEAGVPQNLTDELRQVYCKLIQRGWNSNSGSAEVLTKTVKLSPEAIRLYGEFYNQAKARAAKYKGLLESMLGKATTYAARLALLLHELKWAYGIPVADDISKETMADAIRICSWFMDQAVKVNNLVYVNDGRKDLVKEIHLLRDNNGKVSVREWMRIKSFMNTVETREHLSQMEKAGIGRMRVVVGNGKGRKPGPYFCLYG